MIKIIPSTLSGTTPSVYGVEIEENICQGYYAGNTPTATISVTDNGGVVVAGGVTYQKLTFAVTLTYQPCGMSSETKVKTFAETYLIAVPGSVSTITPIVATTNVVQPTKVRCGNRANGVRVLTSVSVAYS